MTIKKTYTEVVEFLEKNSDKKVSTILPQLLEMCSAKQSAKNFITDESGKVTHVFCYYHKQWEDVTIAEYGNKKHSPSGLNSMCKEGVNNWTKQQREARVAEAKLLDKLADGSLSPDKLQEARQEIADKKSEILPRTDGHIAEVE